MIVTTYLLGIDLGGTNIKVGLLDDTGAILKQANTPTESEQGPDHVVDRIVGQCRQLLGEQGVSAGDLAAVGIGTPGPLSISRGRIIQACNMPGFTDYPLRARISGELDRPAIMENDANAACWGEYWVGAGKEVSRMVMFTLGTGVGGGIISDGVIEHGQDGNGAEVGHMIVHPGGRLCSCGQHGCLEAYASCSQTAARAEEAVREGEPSSLEETIRTHDHLTCKDVFDHARQEDRLALEVIDLTAQMLAQGCINILHLTEPQRAVLAGGMIHSADLLLPRIRSHFNEMVWRLKPESLEICTAKLGTDAGIIGAAGVALDALQKGVLVPPGQ